MLYTASFYEPGNWRGVRYRISRAHPRGKRTDWKVQPFLYPSRALLSEYRAGEIDFRALDQRYREQLDHTLATEVGFRDWLESIRPGIEPETGLTLLCFEPAGTPCHRRSAAAWLLERIPNLQLGQLR